MDVLFPAFCQDQSVSVSRHSLCRFKRNVLLVHVLLSMVCEYVVGAYVNIICLPSLLGLFPTAWTCIVVSIV